MAGPKPMQTEFGIHQRLESCAYVVIEIMHAIDLEITTQFRDQELLPVLDPGMGADL